MSHWNPHGRPPIWSVLVLWWWITLLAAVLLWWKATLTLPVHAQSLDPAVFVLDAPRPPAEDWTLRVVVGETRYAVPRVELRKLVMGHPEWRQK